MVKRTRLERRTPLARTEIPRRHDRMKPVSAKRRKRDAVYPLSRRAIYERAEGMCEATVSFDCELGGYQVHHLAGRGGDDPHRLENLLLCCRPCHEWIHAHPAESYEQGFMVKRHGKGDV